jgi:putative transposase
MAEAFVKTIKRDYARLAIRPDAASVLRQLDAWFEHQIGFTGSPAQGTVLRRTARVQETDGGNGNRERGPRWRSTE